MYAIAFDLDTELLKTNYAHASWNNAYADIRHTLSSHGFVWRQGSVYFGDETVTPVTCVLATQELARVYPWFSSCVRDIRMLRIEENNDLQLAVESAGRPSWRASALVRASSGGSASAQKSLARGAGL